MPFCAVTVQASNPQRCSTRSKKLLGTKGIATRSKDATSRRPAEMGMGFMRSPRARRVGFGGHRSHLSRYKLASAFCFPELECTRRERANCLEPALLWLVSSTKKARVSGPVRTPQHDLTACKRTVVKRGHVLLKCLRPLLGALEAPPKVRWIGDFGPTISNHPPEVR